MPPQSPSQPPPKRRRFGPSTIASTNALSKPFKSPLKTPLQPKQANQLSNLASSPSSSTLDTSNKQTHSPWNPPLALFSTTESQDAAPPTTTPPSSSTPSHTSPPPTQSPLHRIATLQKEHTRLLTELAALRSALNTSTQALDIESNPDRETDMIALTAKWRAASRAAAEEVYRGARDRVNRMGGVAAVRERERERKRTRTEDAWGWEERSAPPERGEDGEGEEGDEGEEVNEMEEMERERREGSGLEDVEAEEDNHEEEDEGDGEGGYTMDMMLKTMNIDLGVIGFDREGQRWID